MKGYTLHCFILSAGPLRIKFADIIPPPPESAGEIKY